MQFKIALLTFKSKTTHRPAYLSYLFKFRATSRQRATTVCFTTLEPELFSAAEPRVLSRRSYTLELLPLPADLKDNFNNTFHAIRLFKLSPAA